VTNWQGLVRVLARELVAVSRAVPGRGKWIVFSVLLRETAEHHDHFEKIAPRHDWWDW
jgi:hypothetical protein